MYKACENVSCLNPIVICYILLNGRYFTGKYFNLSCVIQPFVSTVNFIHSHGLNHCQFHEFLSEKEAEYSDLPYQQQFNNLAVIRGFFVVLFVCFCIFIARGWDWKFSEPEESPSTTIIEHWMELAFAVEVMMLLNKFNLKLQGKMLLTCEIYTAVKSLRWQLTFFELQVMSSYLIASCAVKC